MRPAVPSGASLEFETSEMVRTEVIEKKPRKWRAQGEGIETPIAFKVCRSKSASVVLGTNARAVVSNNPWRTSLRRLSKPLELGRRIR
jgi:hypothetical protein